MEDHCGKLARMWEKPPYIPRDCQGIANQGYFPLLPNDFVFDMLSYSLALIICLLHIHPSAVVQKGLPWKVRRKGGGAQKKQKKPCVFWPCNMAKAMRY